jgi:hypothetical protein
MPEPQNPGTTSAAAKNGGAGDPSQYNKRAPETGARGPEQATRAAEAAMDQTAAAGEEAVRANQEIIRTNVEAAQDAMRAGMEASAQAFETMTTMLTRTFGVAAPDGRLAEQSAQNVRAVSQASTALARGAQEASRAWLDLVQQAARTNLEAVSQLAGCRTMNDIVAVQSNLARDNLQRVIDGGEKIARSTALAVEEANRAMHSTQQGEVAARG